MLSPPEAIEPSRATGPTAIEAPGEQELRRTGVVIGRDEACRWAFIDPRRHPLYVWRQQGHGPTAYASTGSALGAAVFSNGPMMGKRAAPGWKISRGVAAVESVVWPVAIGLAGLALVPATSVWRVVMPLSGVAAGAAIAWQRAFSNWSICGSIRGASAGFEDLSNFDGEGSRHAWLGRRDEDFNSYAVGSGDLPDDIVEGAGGLILLVRNYAVPSLVPDDPTYDRDFAELCQKKGYVAWGLIPLDAANSAGLLVVIGSRTEDARAAGERMLRFGVRDAVLTDQRSMAMLSVENHFFLGPPPPHRQSMQTYGFACV